jgi:hypothetical protein
MPPELEEEQIKNLYAALAKGQPDAAAIAEVTAKGRVRQMI